MKPAKSCRQRIFLCRRWAVFFGQFLGRGASASRWCGCSATNGSRQRASVVDFLFQHDWDDQSGSKREEWFKGNHPMKCSYLMGTYGNNYMVSRCQWCVKLITWWFHPFYHPSQLQVSQVNPMSLTMRRCGEWNMGWSTELGKMSWLPRFELLTPREWCPEMYRTEFD